VVWEGKPARGAFDHALFGFSLGKTFGNLGARFGVADIALGLAKVRTTFFGAFSYYLPLVRDKNYALVGTAGAGSNRFGGVFDKQGTNTVSGFGALALQLNRISFIADYTSKILNSGISFVPSKSFPFVVTVGAFDITHHLPNNNRFRFFVTAGFNIQIFK